MKKILIFSPVATHPPHRGNRQRILQMAGLFRDNGYQIHLAIGRNRTITPDAEEFWDHIHPLKNIPRWRPTKRNVPLDAWYKPGLGEEVAEIVDVQKIDVLLLNYIFHSKLLDYLPPHVVKIIDTHDVFSNRRDLYVGHRYSGGFFSCSKADEVTYLKRADFTVSISQDDTKAFMGLDPLLSVIDLPFVAQIRKTVSEARVAALTPGNRIVGIVLSANDLNVASLHSFISAVDDQYGRTPPFHVYVAGDIFSKSIRIFPHRIPSFSRSWLRYVGPVTEMNSFYKTVDTIAVPVIAGTGMAIKFSEGIASGLPVVSTVHGSRGHRALGRLQKFVTNQELVEAIGNLDKKEMLAAVRACRDCQHDAMKREALGAKKMLLMINERLS